MRSGLVPIGNDSFFYIISYLIKFVKKNLARFRLRERQFWWHLHMLERHMDCLRETSVSRCANRSGKREPIGEVGFPGKPGAYERATFALKILPYGGPIGNSVPGLRPGPALPTIIIPHPGALVKCFLKQK